MKRLGKLLFIVLLGLFSCKGQTPGTGVATNPSQPGTTDPGTTDPGTTDPGTTDPGTTDPGTTDPGTTDPGTTNPGTGGVNPQEGQVGYSYNKHIFAFSGTLPWAANDPQTGQELFAWADNTGEVLLTKVAAIPGRQVKVFSFVNTTRDLSNVRNSQVIKTEYFTLNSGQALCDALDVQLKKVDKDGNEVQAPACSCAFVGSPQVGTKAQGYLDVQGNQTQFKMAFKNPSDIDQSSLPGTDQQGRKNICNASGGDAGTDTVNPVAPVEPPPINALTLVQAVDADGVSVKVKCDHIPDQFNVDILFNAHFEPEWF